MSVESGRRSMREGWDALSRSQKPRAGTPPYTLYVNRPIGRCFAVLAYFVGLTPNQVSLLSFGMSIGGLVYLVLGGHESLLGSIIGVAILLVAYALDSADGQLARLLGAKNPAGAWLDHVLDSLKTPLFHISVTLCVYQSHEISVAALYLLLGAGALNSALFFSNELKSYLLKSRWTPTTIGGKAKILLYLPFDYGAMCFLFLLAPLGWLFSAYAIWGAGLVAFACHSFMRARAMLEESGGGES